MYGYVSVTADSLQEAIDYALHEETPLPEGNYEDGSLCLDEEALEIFEDTSELKRGGYMAIHKNDVDKRNTVLADRITVYFDRANNVRAS